MNPFLVLGIVFGAFSLGLFLGAVGGLSLGKASGHTEGLEEAKRVIAADEQAFKEVTLKIFEKPAAFQRLDAGAPADAALN